ncbi:MAG TPA: DUF2975 domain-containing protein [Rhizomicrobium sp.]
MASVSSLLPRIFHWVFLVLTVVFVLAALIVVVVMLANPHMPPGAHLGPAEFTLAGQPGTIALRSTGTDSDFLGTAFGGNVSVAVEKAGGLVELLKHYGLPLILTKMIFLAALFELLRRLFRNVGRGESFTRNTIRLVQGVGGLLLLFSFFLAFAEGLFFHNVFTYLAQHAVITVSGTPVHFPAPHREIFPREDDFPFGSPLFFSGLLVLALSEVFRQGLALKDENALTI